MFKTRVCDFSDLHPPLYDFMKAADRADDPIQYCIEACHEFSDKPPLYVAYVLTQSRLMCADMQGGRGAGTVWKYLDIERIAEGRTNKGDQYYVVIFLSALVAKPNQTEMCHFETPEKAHSFANLLRKLANIKQQ